MKQDLTMARLLEIYLPELVTDLAQLSEAHDEELAKEALWQMRPRWQEVLETSGVIQYHDVTKCRRYMVLRPHFWTVVEDAAQVVANRQ